MYVFQLFDYYSASGMTLLWVCFCQSIAVAWVYGAGRFCNDIRRMVGYSPPLWLPIAWSYTTPAITLVK